jgi:hypothetical protein
MEKHTPGPWKVTQHDMGAFIRCPADYIIAGPVDTRRGHEANARLIAAAPELLEALREFVEAFEGCYADGEPAMIKAKAAIAKATGEKK